MVSVEVTCYSMFFHEFSKVAGQAVQTTQQNNLRLS